MGVCVRWRRTLSPVCPVFVVSVDWGTLSSASTGHRCGRRLGGNSVRCVVCIERAYTTRMAQSAARTQWKTGRSNHERPNRWCALRREQFSCRCNHPPQRTQHSLQKKISTPIDHHPHTHTMRKQFYPEIPAWGTRDSCPTIGTLT